MLFSKCCLAKVKVEGGMPEDGDRGGTRYFVCQKCDNPCDIVTSDSSFNDAEPLLLRLINEGWKVMLDINPCSVTLYYEDLNSRSIIGKGNTLGEAAFDAIGKINA